MTLTLGLEYEDNTFEIKKYKHLSEIRIANAETGNPIQLFANNSKEAKDYYGLEDVSFSVTQEDDFLCEYVYILEFDKKNPVLQFNEDHEFEYLTNMNGLRYFLFNILV